MRFMKYFSNHKVSSTEIHSAEPSGQSTPQHAGETPDPGRAAASTSGIQAALDDSSNANQPAMVPQSIINPGSPNDQTPSADQARADPALNNIDKILSALQVVSGATLPFALPQAAKLASQLLTLVEDKRRNDDGIRTLTLDISKIILALVKPLGKKDPTVTTDQEKVVADVISYLETLHAFCNEYLKGNSVSRFFFSSAWKEKIADIRRGVQTQLLLVNMATVLEVLNTLNSSQQQVSTSHETSLDQAFHKAEFSSNCDVDINNFTQSGLNQSLPIPPNQDSSNAFKGAKFGGGKIKINNHHKHFGQHSPW